MARAHARGDSTCKRAVSGPSGRSDFRRVRRAARRHVLSEPHRGNSLPTPAVDQRATQELDVRESLERGGVLEQPGGEDEAIGRSSNPILFGAEQLTRPELLQGMEHPPICLSTFRSHSQAVATERSQAIMLTAEATSLFSQAAKDRRGHPYIC